jgi:hypothetical protein
MAQAESNHTTIPHGAPPVDPTRRRFLSQAAGVAAGSAVLAVATIPPASAATAPASALASGEPDPVFDLIASHKKIMGTVNAIAAEINQADQAGEIDEIDELQQGVFAEQNGVEFGLFIALTEAVPTTLAGVVALVTYLDEINKRDPWKFEDGYATPLIGALATAFNRVAVQFA